MRALQGKGGDEVRVVAAENIRKSVGEQRSSVFEVYFVAIQAGRGEGTRIAEEAMEFLHGLDQQIVCGHPYRTAPVGIAPEQRGIGFPGNIPDKRVANPGNMSEVLAGGMMPGYRADTVRGEEFLFVEETSQYLDQHGSIHQGQQVFPTFVGMHWASAYPASITHSTLMSPQQRVESGAPGQQPRIHHFTRE